MVGTCIATDKERHNTLLATASVRRIYICYCFLNLNRGILTIFHREIKVDSVELCT